LADSDSSRDCLLEIIFFLQIFLEFLQETKKL
jgi:hypothetical protein